MRTEILDYPADGLAMQGWLAYDEAAPGPRPGVLIFPAMPGLGVQTRTSAERLAALGYVALACDLYGGGLFYDDIDAAVVALKALRASGTGLLNRAQGALDALVRLPQVDPGRVAAIGYCLGGEMSLDLARSGAAIGAVVGFHTRLTAQRPAAIHPRCKILICNGALDHEAPPEDRVAFEREMTAAGVDWRLHLYGGVYHSFTNPDADAYNRPDYARYDARAHARSWLQMMGLFDEAFGPV
jgi:dienelactone hydrolase